MAEEDRLVIEAELRDNVSGPARRAEAATERLAASARRAGTNAGGAGSSGLASMARSSDRLARMATQADRQLVTMSRTLSDRVTRAARTSMLAITALATVAVGFGVKSAASFEQSRIAFGTMLEDVSRGNALFNELKAFNLRTPFDLPEITRTAQVLMGMGFTAEQLVPTLTAASDAASGLGAGAEGLGRIALNLGQMKTQGRATGRELRDLAVLGVPSYALVASILGKTTEQVRAMGDSASVSGDQFIDAFIRMQGPMAKFSGSSAAQAKTLTGIWSNFKDLVGQSLAEQFEESGAGEQLRVTLPRLATVLAIVGASLMRLVGVALPLVTPLIEGIASGLDRMLRSAGPAVDALEPLGGQVGKSIAGALTTLAPVLPDVVGLLGNLLLLLPDMIRLLGALLLLASPAIKLANALLSFAPTRAIFAGILVVLLGYSKLSAAFKAMRTFADLLGLIALRQTAVASTAGGAGVGGAVGAAGSIGGRLGRFVPAVVPAAVAVGGALGPRTTANDLQAIGGAAATGALLGSAIPGLGTALGALAGGALGAGYVGARRLFGDTARPHGGPGGLLGAADAITGGSRLVTSGARSWGWGGLGSDHDPLHHRAYDLTGSYLNAYKATVERLGGFAEFHGSGSGRHLHAVGDSPRPARVSSTAGGGDTYTVTFGDVIVRSEVDIERAVAEGISRARREGDERAARGV